MPDLTAFFEDIGEARFHGVDAGAGLPVVFLHAGVTDHRMFASQVGAVAAAGYRAMAYDRRGFGKTDAPDEPFSHIDDLEAVLDARGIRAAVFVCCSMGGALAIDFALENPERIVGLVLVGTALSGSEEPELDDAVLPLIEAMEIAEEQGDIDMQNKVAAHAWLDGPTSPNGRVGGTVRDLFVEMHTTMLAKPPLTEEIEPESAIDDLDAVSAPVLLVVGDRDFAHIVERHDELSDIFENAFATVIEDAAHLLPLEKPAVFNRLLLEFLEAVGGEPEAGEG